MAGYSQTPLLKKLGIKPGDKIWLVHVPANYATLIGPLPDDIQLLAEGGENINFIHFFTQVQAELIATFPILKKALANDGMIWISWPKKTSGQPTDLNENIIREIGLAESLVDVKVAAVDEVWSGLKFVYRLKDR